MNTKEIIPLIKIGFGCPRFYKRSVWNKAVKVMEYLADNTHGDVVRTNLGEGREKYTSLRAITDEQLAIWALAYKRSLGFPIYVEEAVPELERIARELGVDTCDGKVTTEYFRRHPEDIM